MLLPETDHQQAIEQLIALDSVDGLLSRDIEQVDMRLADRITIRLSEEAAEATRSNGKSGAKRPRAVEARI